MRKGKYVISEIVSSERRKVVAFTDVFSPDGGKRASVLVQPLGEP